MYDFEGLGGVWIEPGSLLYRRIQDGVGLAGTRSL